MWHFESVHVHFQLIWAQAVHHQRLTSKTPFESQASPYAVYGGKSGTGQVFLGVL